MIKFNFMPVGESVLSPIKNGYAPQTIVTEFGSIMIDREGVVTLPTETWVLIYTPEDKGAKQIQRGKFWARQFELAKGTAASFKIAGIGRIGVSNDWPTEWMREQALRNLKLALRDIVFAGQKATVQEMWFGNPISCLLERILEIGLEETAKEIFNAREWRLNGAGLKILVTEREEGYRVFVRGDQYVYYPTSGPAFNEILAALGLQ